MQWTTTSSDALSPILASSGLDLVDVGFTAPGPGHVDRPGGVDLDDLADANRDVSRALDALDPYPGSYTLEVSSPGLERRLRTPAHFARAVGETVTVRLPEAGRRRRVTGVLRRRRGDRVHLEGPDVPGGSMRIAYDQVERARTVFEWGAREAGGRANQERVKRS